MDIDTKKESNVIFKPKPYSETIVDTNMDGVSGNTDQVVITNANLNALNNTASILNRSSMMTYGKIVCCICTAPIDANQRGMCSACAKTEIDITEGITKQTLMHYCKGCDRYLRPPWVRCDLESADMMSLCLSKIKGLSRVKLVDSGFVWTEPHSKMIKIKLTVQKEVDKTLMQTSFICEFKVEWTQCDDCKKTFTPHIWNASCQIRQKVKHKRTFMLLEQIILKHRAHRKALNIKEEPEGVDFYYTNKSQAMSLANFIHSVIPCKVKDSKRLVSHDQHSNVFNYKYTLMVELAPVCKDDIIILDKETTKKLGGINPVLLCHKVSTKIHLVDPLTLNTYDFDENTYWRHNFKSYVDRSCLEEFLIMNVEEEIDYKAFSKPDTSSQMTVDEGSKVNNNSKSTNYKNVMNSTLNNSHIHRKDFKPVLVQCIFNNKTQDGNVQVFTVRTHLGQGMRPGDIYYGYDISNLNVNEVLEENLSKSCSLPDIILVKKKYRRGKGKRIWKLQHLDKEMDVDMKAKDKIDKDYEDFLEEVEENKETRKQINLFRNEDVIRELEKKMGTMGIVNDDDDKNDSEIDIKVEELLGELTINDKADPATDVEPISNEEEVNTNPTTVQKGKRDRTGNNLQEEDS